MRGQEGREEHGSFIGGSFMPFAGRALLRALSINKPARSSDKNGSVSSRREELEKRNCKFSPCFESSKRRARLNPTQPGWKNVQRLSIGFLTLAA